MSGTVSTGIFIGDGPTVAGNGQFNYSANRAGSQRVWMLRGLGAYTVVQATSTTGTTNTGAPLAGPSSAYQAGDVVLVSHDGDFVDDLGALLDGRRVGVMGFTEFRNAGFAELPGIQFFDLEYDVEAFDASLPRVRIIAIDEFDPAQFLR